MFSTLITSAVAGLVVPFITEFLTKAGAPVWVRSVLNFGLSSLAGVVATASIGDYSSINEYIVAILAAWLTNMRMHYTGATKPIAVATANIGIGKREE